MSTAQLNARIDARVKSEGDSTLARFGLGTTDAIRALWQHLAQTKELPDFLRTEAPRDEEHLQSTGHAEEGAGMALRLAHAQNIPLSPIDAAFANPSYAELRERAFEERVEEGKYRV